MGFPDFLASLRTSFVVLPWLHFQALRRMKLQRERSDGVGQGRLGGISPFFTFMGKED